MHKNGNSGDMVFSNMGQFWWNGWLDGVTSFLRLKDVTNICKCKRRSLSIGGSSSVQWRTV